MSGIAHTGLLLVVLAVCLSLHWASRRAAAAAVRRGERVEAKVDALLDYLALQRERELIDSAVGRGLDDEADTAKGAGAKLQRP